MARRKAISKRDRFEIFKRDSFSCQYCGKSSPDVILHVDHVKPVSKGGTNDLLNLVTSCADCNLGKSDIELSDDTAIAKQRKQLKEMSERSEQVRMMIDWRESIMQVDDDLTASAIKLIISWKEVNPNTYFYNELKKGIKKHGYNAVCDLIDGFATGDKTGEEYLTGILKSIKYIGTKQDPAKAKLHYIKAILANRVSSFNEKKYFTVMNGYKLTLKNLETIEAISKVVNSSTEFYEALEEIMRGF